MSERTFIQEGICRICGRRIQQDNAPGGPFWWHHNTVTRITDHHAAPKGARRKASRAAR